MGAQPVAETLDAGKEVEVAAGAQHGRVQGQQTVGVAGDALVVAAEGEGTVGDGRGGVTGFDGGGHHEAGAGAEIEVRHGGAQVEGVEEVAAGAVEREEGLRLGGGIEGGETGRVGAGGGAGHGEVVGRDVEVVGVAGVGGGGQGGVEGLADEGEELADVVEDVVGGAGEEQAVVGRDEGDAVGETVGCDAGDGPHMSTTAAMGHDSTIIIIIMTCVYGGSRSSYP